MTNVIYKIHIIAHPTIVAVQDERQFVDGAYVTVRIAGETIAGDIIPPEGDNPACWLGSVYRNAVARLWCDDLCEALQAAAERGAAGAPYRLRCNIYV